MGWSLGFDETWNRDIGYGVPAYCDHPECYAVIDRGLSYVCGGEPYGGENGCGLYFCGQHLVHTRNFQSCRKCARYEPVELRKPKCDHPDWVHHKSTDPSWKKWRKEKWQLAIEQN